LGMDSEQ